MKLAAEALRAAAFHSEAGVGGEILPRPADDARQRRGGPGPTDRVLQRMPASGWARCSELVDHRIAESHRRDYCYERNL